MAKGPKDLEPRRIEETERLEKIIDRFIEEFDGEGDIYIPLQSLPRIKLNLERVRKLYYKVGWKTVDIYRIFDGDHLRLSTLDYSPDWR